MALRLRRGFRLGRKLQRLDPFALELFFQLARFPLKASAFQFQAFAVVSPGDLPPAVAFHQDRALRNELANREHRVDADHENQARTVEAREQNERPDFVECLLEETFANVEADDATRPWPIARQKTVEELNQTRAGNKEEPNPRESPHEQSVGNNQFESAEPKKNGGDQKRSRTEE